MGWARRSTVVGSDGMIIKPKWVTVVVVVGAKESTKFSGTSRQAGRAALLRELPLLLLLLYGTWTSKLTSILSTLRSFHCSSSIASPTINLFLFYHHSSPPTTLIILPPHLNLSPGSLQFSSFDADLCPLSLTVLLWIPRSARITMEKVVPQTR